MVGVCDGGLLIHHIPTICIFMDNVSVSRGKFSDVKMEKKEVILIDAFTPHGEIYKLKLSDSLKMMRNIAKRARRKMNNRNGTALPGSFDDYYYAKRCIQHIENALTGKYNIIVVSKTALNILKKEGVK